MCGIIGIVGKQPVAERLIESLKRLEYRGYDSAGIAGVVCTAVGVHHRTGTMRQSAVCPINPARGSRRPAPNRGRHRGDCPRMVIVIYMRVGPFSSKAAI